MNTTTVLLIVLGIVAGTGVVLGFLLPFLKKNGVDVSGILTAAKEVVATANKAVDTIRPFVPESAGLGLFDKILNVAKIGVGQAEQLYHIGELDADKRKQEATEYIRQALALAEVEITPEVETLINGAIEANVLELGHKPK